MLTQVPPSLLAAFNESELLRLLVGQPTVDVNEIRAFAQFQVSRTFPHSHLARLNCHAVPFIPFLFLFFSSFFLGLWLKIFLFFKIYQHLAGRLGSRRRGLPLAVGVLARLADAAPRCLARVCHRGFAGAARWL